MSKKLPLVYLSRRECFSAAHTLNSKHLTPEQNKEIYTKCNNCHGHNYVVEVTVKSGVDATTGMVINACTLRNYMMQLIEQLDHKNLDVDVDYFKENVSTAENLTVFFWNRLEEKLANESCKLHEVKIFETEKNICVYRGETI